MEFEGGGRWEEPIKFLRWPNGIKEACIPCYPAARILPKIRAATSPVVKQWQKLFLGEAGPMKTFAILVSDMICSYMVPLT